MVSILGETPIKLNRERLQVLWQELAFRRKALASTLSAHIIEHTSGCMLGNFVCFLLSAAFFKSKFFQNTIRVSNGLDPDQAQQNFRPGLGPNCLQSLSADILVKKELTQMDSSVWFDTMSLGQFNCTYRPLKKKTKNWFSRPIIA